MCVCVCACVCVCVCVWMQKMYMNDSTRKKRNDVSLKYTSKIYQSLNKTRC